MSRITRRIFLKASALFGVTLAIGKYMSAKTLSFADLVNPAHAAQGKVKKLIGVVSDVDAHSQCSMRVGVQGGTVTAIAGDPTDPESKGQLTVRGEHMKEILYAPDRLKHPMKRVGERGEGRWERISWDEALKTIADRLKEIKQNYGPEAIDFHHGHYHSGNILGSYLARLANLIGTPNITNPSHVCHLPRVFLEFNYDLGAVVAPDVAHTKCLIIWGGNPEATNKPQEIAIKEARARGVNLIVIDPRRTSYAKGADLHAQLRPGTDGALALGLLHVIIKEGLYDKEFVEKWTIGFEKLEKHIEQYSPEKVEKITWVPAKTITDIARMYATAKPACISPRNALDQHTNSSVAIRAIDILMAITGNLDVKGGNIIIIPISMGMEDIKLFDKLPHEAANKKLGADRCLYSKISTTWPAAHTPSLWDAIIHGEPYPVKAMVVMASNPRLACANTTVVEEALKKLDFLAVADLFMTPTAELADIVLPACTFLERTRFVTYDTHADHSWNVHSRIALSPKAVEPLEESRSDWKIICELGRAMGYGEYFPWKTEEEAIDHVLTPLGITCEELADHPEGIIMPVPSFLYTKFTGVFGTIMRKVLKLAAFRDYPDMYKKYESKGFMTPSKKVELYSERLEKLGYDALPTYREPAESPVSRPDLAEEYPLILIAGTKLEMYTHSEMRNIPGLRRLFPENLLEINPETAAKKKIAEGDFARISSPRGSIRCRVQVTDRIDPRVVHLCHGFKESNCNVLTDHKAFDPITGSVGMKSLLCRIEKI
ncbi:MAG: molybdopterin-dependent oxidoreductase [Deltaproteobacteria bacterium]|nr:molybdopterin-dependent oxidoreductase [Deltaproteobacteria bacterium]